MYLAFQNARAKRGEFANKFVQPAYSVQGSDADTFIDYNSTSTAFETAQRAKFSAYDPHKGKKTNADVNDKAGRQRSGGAVISQKALGGGGDQKYMLDGDVINAAKAKNYTDVLAIRSKEAVAARKRDAVEREYQLSELISKDQAMSVGGKLLQAANRATQQANASAAQLKKTAAEQGLKDQLMARPFTPEAIRLIGFDPTRSSWQGGLLVENGEEGKKRVSTTPMIGFDNS